MTIMQLNPPLPLYVVNKGNGLAHFLIDYGMESHLFWVIAMNDSGECWTLDNTKIRFEKNISLNRNLDNKNIKINEIREIIK
jgi:hypothetical protein